MEPNVNYKLVGAFVVIMAVATMFTIIWMSSGFSLQAFNTYKVYMQESVSGLSIDSSVEYNGVSVGNVKSIDINKKNPQLVEVLLNIKNSTPITGGTVATLSSRGLTGVVYVSLKDAGKNRTLLKAMPGEPYPVIPVVPSLFLRLETAMTQINSSFEVISERVGLLLSKNNIETLKETVYSIREVINTLKANKDNFNIIFTNTSKASQQFAPFIKSSSKVMELLESQTLPGVLKLYANLNLLTNDAGEIFTEIKQNPSVLIRGKILPAGPGEGKSSHCLR